ncbi:hypothetical protein C823_003731 [Eubacterium plexicaudatum ASF492]|nr:hypothetical protein C823_003731 [Eubacterium plexicaudatum ASF492]
MRKKRILAGALGCMLVCSQPFGYAAASESPQERQNYQNTIQFSQDREAADVHKQSQLPKTPDDLAPDELDPDYVKMLYQQENPQQSAPFSMTSIEAKTTKSPFTGLVYTHAAQLSDCDIVDGIDVSKWQADINWKKVKAAGVKFVFIRCGYTALSKDFAMYEDEYFKKNIQGAYDAGIKVGVYFFSNSINTTEAKKKQKNTGADSGLSADDYIAGCI